jgi:glycosyltransferase involved in cell wall biosynthesis
MRCPTLTELPPPPPGKTGWPWTGESPAFPATQPSGAPWPKIGVVTPSFNQAEFLEQTIRSILLQGYPDLEYVIIDGGSTDQSTAIIRKYERWLSYWVSEPDQGCSDASAKGLARTAADLLGVMNSDDFFAQGAFGKLLALRLAHPQNVLWGGASPELDLTGKQIAAKQPFVRDQTAIGNWGVGAWFFSPACLFDGPAYRAVGGFDPRFFNAGDVELWIRLAKIGTFVFTPETVAFVHRNPQSISRRDELGGDIALVAANYLHGHQDIARAKMTRYIKNWLHTLNTNQTLAPDSATGILAQAPAGILARALGLRVARIIRHPLRRIFRRPR